MLVGCIEANDDRHLTAAERVAIGTQSLRLMRQSGAARRLARTLLLNEGLGPCSILWSDLRAPLFPTGIVGSLAHDATHAVAVLASRDDYAGLGVDIEPALPLPDEIRRIVVTDAERDRHRPEVLASRALFCAKEAVFKALHPQSRSELDFLDVEINGDLTLARTVKGLSLGLAIRLEPYVLAAAWLRPVV